MRILFITNYPLLYGANRSLFSLLEKFNSQGENVCLLIPKKGGMTEELTRVGIRYIAFPYMSSFLYTKNFHSVAKTIGKPLLVFATFWVFPILLYKVWRYKPDIIYSNSCSDNLGILFAKILKKYHIQHVRDFMDLDHGMKFIFGNKAKKKYINKSDAVIYVSHSVAEYTQQSKNLPNNHVVIYNGVKMDSEKKYEKKDIPTCINFGIVGLLDEGKGQHLAIEYYNKIKDAYPNSLLHIWGDKEGEYKKRLVGLVEEFGLRKKVIFHGFEKNPDVIYKEMSVLLMCSRMEGFGRVTIEAMQRGIPVLGYDSGGTSELVKHGYNGFLFKTENDFCNAVRIMFGSNDSYNTLCRQAFDDAHQHYTEEIYAKNVYNFVKNIFE